MTQRTCDVGHCGRPQVARGYCDPHYREWRRCGVAVSVRAPREPKACAFLDCGRRVRSSGLCGGHYLQRHRGEELRPLREYIDTTELDEHGRKRCSRCREWKAVEEFYSHAATKGGRHPRCMRCFRDTRMQATYGISLDRYEAMLQAQGGGCAVCGGVNESGRALSVDHDHACCPGAKSCGSCVRELLCDNCNRCIGLMRDDPQRLERAAAYLRRHTRE